MEFNAIGQTHGIDMPCHFAREFERLRPWQAASAVELDGTSLRLTPTGRLAAHAVAGIFDRYQQLEPGRPRRSRPA